MKNKKIIGDMGEKIAEKYLEKRGWRIISNNYKTHGGEIDLIGYRFGVLVYFEVKTRSNGKYGSPADAVDGKKIAHIKTAARSFKSTYSTRGRIPVFYPLGIEKLRKIRQERIDVIEVYLENGESKIHHIKNWGNRL